MNPLFRTVISISDSLKSVRKSVLIYETIIIPEFKLRFHKTEDGKVLVILDVYKGDETPYYDVV